MVVAEVTWTAALSAIGAVTTPFAVAGIGFLLSRQLKRIEARQWRNQELIAARLGYYREIAEPLNDLMCYFTFIGSWKEWSPPEIIEIKRSLDKTFHTLVPFFSVEVANAYESFMGRCFKTFGRRGADARFNTSYRRRQSVGNQPWQAEWNALFMYSTADPMPDEEIVGFRDSYNDLLARLVGDIELTDARTNYATAQVVLNA
jgi:hypothetical protein